MHRIEATPVLLVRSTVGELKRVRQSKNGHMAYSLRATLITVKPTSKYHLLEDLYLTQLFIQCHHPDSSICSFPSWSVKLPIIIIIIIIIIHTIRPKLLLFSCHLGMS